MKKRFSWLFGAAMAATLVAPVAPAAQPEITDPGAQAAAEYLRSWSQHPAVQQLDTNEAIYVAGDIHANLIPVMTTLRAHGLIAAVPDLTKSNWLTAVKWTGGRAVLVQMGDMVTKGPWQVETLRFLRELQGQAATAEGRVICVLGNNDAKYLGIPKDSKMADVYKAFEAIQPGLALQVAAGTDAEGIGRWLRDLPLDVRINGFYFRHGGFTGGLSIPQLEATYQAVILPSGGTTMNWAAPELMDEIDNYVQEQGSTPPVYRYGQSWLQLGLPNFDTASSGIEEHPHPYWWHPLFYEPVPVTNGVPGPTGTAIPDDPDGSKAILTRFTEALGVEHIVMGHEWKLQLVDVNGVSTWIRPRSQCWYHCGSSVRTDCPALLFFTDVGMTSGYKPGSYTSYPADPKPAFSMLRIANDGQRLSVSVLSQDPGTSPAYVLYSEVMGDLDLDGKINAADLALLKKATGGIRNSTGYNRRADLNNDGRVDVYDLVDWMRLYTLGLPAKPAPAPTPTWGLAP